MAVTGPRITAAPTGGAVLNPRQRLLRRSVQLLALLALLAVSVVILTPAAWMISTSLKPDSQVFAYPPRWLPDPPQWGNYVRAWLGAPFTRYAVNTLLYAGVVTAATVFVNAFVAYGFAKLRFPGRDALFVLLLSSMMIPGMVTLIPQYVLFSKLHWVGSYAPLVVPAFFASAFYTFMLRQFFLGLPNDLIEAARIDGASELWIWWRVAVPLAAPALATVALFTFDGAWNDYVGPLLYLTDDRLYTLQVGLQFFRTSYSVQWQLLMAASILVLLPVVVLFYAFQKYFVEGASLSGAVKG